MGIFRDSAYYGVGFVGATPVGGGAPIYFGLAEGISVEFSKTLVPLRGSPKYPVGFGEGECSIKGKIDTLNIFGGSLAQLLGGSTEEGQEIIVPNETAVIPKSPGPYVVEVVYAETFVSDCHVFDLTKGKPLMRVSGSPSEGEYAVSDGTYTFAEANAEDAISIAYVYSSATGTKAMIQNCIQTIAPLYRLACASADSIEGGRLYQIFPTVAFAGFSITLKTGSWATTNLEWEACADLDEDLVIVSTQL